MICHTCQHSLVSTCSYGLHITCEKYGSDMSYMAIVDCEYFEMAGFVKMLCTQTEPFFSEEEFAI